MKKITKLYQKIKESENKSIKLTKEEINLILELIRNYEINNRLKGGDLDGRRNKR